MRARRSLPDIVITTTTITTLLNTRTHKPDSARGGTCAGAEPCGLLLTTFRRQAPV
ncbi:MAG: hypothetical protein ABSE46_17590 [Terracidiphilus sp.]